MNTSTPNGRKNILPPIQTRGAQLLKGYGDQPPPYPPLPPFVKPFLGRAPDIYMGLREPIPPDYTPEQVLQYVVQKGPTDSQLQAHCMAYLRDVHNMHFSIGPGSPNPNAPQPCYWNER